MTVNPKTLVVDVDDTISTHINRDYENAIPHKEMIQKLNDLYDAGWDIIYFTARGQVSCDGDLEKIEKERGPILRDWMKRNDVRYTQLKFGKPIGVYYIDDKALRPDEFMKFEFKTLRGGSGAEVELIGNKVIKKGPNLQPQVDWYKRVSSKLPYVKTPKIYTFYGDTLELEYIKGVQLNEVIDTTNIHDLMRLVEDIYILDTSIAGVPMWDTMRQRIVDHLMLNPIPHQNEIINEIIDIEDFMNDNTSFMHGDLTLGNIIASLNGLYVIDPNYINGVYSSFILDYGKIYQSLHKGYEEMFLGAKINPKRELVFNKFEELINKDYGESYVYAIRLAEIIHYIRMLKYKTKTERLLVHEIIRVLYHELKQIKT